MFAKFYFLAGIAANGEPYYTYRIVKTSRTRAGVKQPTLLNLGKHFNIDSAHWSLLAQRIDEIIQAQSDNTQQTLFNLSLDLDASLEILNHL